MRSAVPIRLAQSGRPSTRCDVRGLLLKLQANKSPPEVAGKSQLRRVQATPVDCFGCFCVLSCVTALHSGEKQKEKRQSASAGEGEVMVIGQVVVVRLAQGEAEGRRRRRRRKTRPEERRKVSAQKPNLIGKLQL